LIFRNTLGKSKEKEEKRTMHSQYTTAEELRRG
jgi:hypothetical protein